MITVPAIWRQEAKQFMREAAYQVIYNQSSIKTFAIRHFLVKAGIASRESPGQLVIALEPEVASVYCRRLKLNQLVSDIDRQRLQRSRGSDDRDLEDSVLVMDEAGVGESTSVGLFLTLIQLCF